MAAMSTRQGLETDNKAESGRQNSGARRKAKALPPSPPRPSLSLSLSRQRKRLSRNRGNYFFLTRNFLKVSFL
jgi:hypothetical protein